VRTPSTRWGQEPAKKEHPFRDIRLPWTLIAHVVEHAHDLACDWRTPLHRHGVQLPDRNHLSERIGVRQVVPYECLIDDATGAPPATSWSLNARPRSIRIPNVWKYPGVTTFKPTTGRDPSSLAGRPAILKGTRKAPRIGKLTETAVWITPGTAATLERI